MNDDGGGHRQDAPIVSAPGGDPLSELLLELHARVDALRSSLQGQAHHENLIGASPAFVGARELAAKAAQTTTPVLLTGEQGTGKSRLARLVHNLSTRRDGPFVTVPCTGLRAGHLEAGLRGAPEAVGGGYFALADRGTLFFEEVCDLSLPAQAALLRTLEDERSRGGVARVRLVASSCVDLEEAVLLGRFRRDLHHLLGAFPIEVPPLRARTGDLAPLVRSLLRHFSGFHGKRLLGVAEEAMGALTRYQWPGNVRELENVLERGVILAESGAWLELEHFGAPVCPRASAFAPPVIIEDGTPASRARLLEAYFAAGGSVDEVEAMARARAAAALAAQACRLGITRSQSRRLARAAEEGAFAEHG